MSARASPAKDDVRQSCSTACDTSSCAAKCQSVGGVAIPASDSCGLFPPCSKLTLIQYNVVVRRMISQSKYRRKQPRKRSRRILQHNRNTTINAKFDDQSREGHSTVAVAQLQYVVQRKIRNATNVFRSSNGAPITAWRAPAGP